MKTKGMKKLSKALAIFMTVFMLMGMMPQAAFADEVPADDNIIQQEQQLDDENQNIDDPAEEQQEQQQQPEPDMSNVPAVASEEASQETASGTVYMSVSYDGKYINDKDGGYIAYVPVSLSAVSSVNLDEYGLSEYNYDEDGDGTYDITALHLIIYAHEKLYGGDWSEVDFTGSPGSSYFQGGVFGFDENLNYYLNGEYPLASAGWGATSDQIVLEAGDYIDMASFSSWNFYSDTNYGFHFFADGNGAFTHDYSAEAGKETNVKLVRSYSGMGSVATVYDEPYYTVAYGTSLYDAAGTVTTDDLGYANIAFPTAGTWYVWADGGYGMEYPDDIVSSPAFAKVVVNEAENPDQEAADEVIAKINEIGDNITLDSESAIVEARTAYDALTDAQKALVTNLAELTTAEVALAALKTPTTTEFIYIAISEEGNFINDQNGNPIAYTSVSLNDLKSIDLEEYGLGEYLYDKDGDGNYDVTALHLYIYIHEVLMGKNWSDVTVTGSPGSIYFAGGLFGYEDENMRYNYNGAYPADENGWGFTADRIVLSDGDFLEVAHFSDWSFCWDSAYGFHYFVDENDEATLKYETEAGKALSVTLTLVGGGMGMGSSVSNEAGYTVYYGTSIGDETGSVTTDDNGVAEVTFDKAGTYYIWCEGGEGVDAAAGAIVSSPACATVTVTAGAMSEPTPESADPIDVCVTIADEGDIVMAKEAVTVTDRDASGDFTVDEVLYAAHEAEYAGGAEAGYATAETAYGLGITKLWGDTSGNYGYWLNDASCWSLSDKVVADDHLVSFVYQNTEVWDSYSKFDKDSYSVRAEEAVTVTLEKAGYDTNWNTVFSKHNGAEIKVYSSDFKELDTDDYEVVDNGDGTYSITIKNTESYIIAAYDNTTPIVPAVSTVVVTENADLVYADAVEAKITAIGTVTLESEDAIKEARNAYDELNDSQKALVENVNILNAAENELIALKAGAAADQAAANAVIALIEAIDAVDVHSGSKVNDAREGYDALTDSQKALVTNYDKLTAAEKELGDLYEAAAKTDHKAIYEETGKYLTRLGTPSVGSTGGEWMVIDITRAGGSCPEGYYDNVIKYVKDNILDGEKLHRAKSTDNSRVILGLTSAGYDVTDVAGHNLLKGLTDMTYLKKQGINGPIWALIAFDSHDYDIPAGGDVTRDSLIETILAAQHNDGGWSLSAAVDKPSDPDMTGMALQALAPYYNTNVDVKTAVDKSLEYLSKTQSSSGGFGSIDGKCTESCAQVIVALTALGINPETDSRFVKNGMSVVDAMCTFAVEGGGFAHVPNGTLNGMATEQGQYALAAYYRMLDGKTSLYDMTDVTIGNSSDDGTSEGGTTGDADNNEGKNENKNQQSGNKTTTKTITKSANVKLANTTVTEEQLAQGRENHYCEETGVDARDNSNDILPWYIKLNVVKQEITDDQKAKVSEALGGEGELFILKDIHFTNTKDGSEWQPTKPVKIKIPMVDIGDYENAVIVHITDDGKIELIKGTVKDGMIEFEADSFSLYGIAGTNTSINDLLVVEDDGAVVWPWIVIAIIALAAIAYIAYRRKREA